MHRLVNVLNMIDQALDTKRKKYIAGGILLGITLMFGSLTVTVITLK